LIANVTLDTPAVGLQFDVHGAAGGDAQLDGVHTGEQLNDPLQDEP
jgi:hypothetical protein